MTKKKFTRLTAAQKRVAIAKDVLQQIRLRTMVPAHVGYFLWTDRNRIESFNQESVKHCSCFVCGIGAGIVSGIRLFNKVHVSENRGFAAEAFPIAKKFFTAQQAALIEMAFEGSCIMGNNANVEMSVSAYAKARKFYERHTLPRERVQAIYQNIINNKGVFKP